MTNVYVYQPEINGLDVFFIGPREQLTIAQQMTSESENLRAKFQVLSDSMYVRAFTDTVDAIKAAWLCVSAKDSIGSNVALLLVRFWKRNFLGTTCRILEKPAQFPPLHISRRT